MNLFSSQKNDNNSSDSSSSETILNTAELNNQENPLVEIIRFAVLALLIVLPIRYFVAQPFIVSGASMESTFHGSEYLIVDQLSYYLDEPERGDVVIFRFPKDHSKFFIKRIIGLPGETVKISDQSVTIINPEHPEGLTIDEPYVDDMKPSDELTTKLGPEEYYVMGDNRNASSDSRLWGPLKKDEIIGRAFLRLYPVSKIDIFPGKHDSTEAFAGTETESIINPN